LHRPTPLSESSYLYVGLERRQHQKTNRLRE
jgi:hypothetical protein